MDPDDELTAADVVNTWDERRLATLLRDYGEERYARPIARALVRARAAAPMHTTNELVEVVTAAVPVPARFASGHPAKRVFQAIRIAVNDELGQLDAALPARLGPAARTWPVCRDFLPFAGRPPREALPGRQGAGLHLPAGLPGVRLRSRPGGGAAHAPRRGAHARRGRRQPPRAVRPDARRTEARGDPSMTPPATHRRPPSDAHRAPRARRAAPAAPVLRTRPAQARSARGRHGRHRGRAAAVRDAPRHAGDAGRRRPRARPPRPRAGVDRDHGDRAHRHRLHAGLAAQAQRRHQPGGDRGRHLRSPELEPARGHLQARLGRAHPGRRGEARDGDAGRRRRALPRRPRGRRRARGGRDQAARSGDADRGAGSGDDDDAGGDDRRAGDHDAPHRGAGTDDDRPRRRRRPPRRDHDRDRRGGDDDHRAGHRDDRRRAATAGSAPATTAPPAAGPPAVAGGASAPQGQG